MDLLEQVATFVGVRLESPRQAPQCGVVGDRRFAVQLVLS